VIKVIIGTLIILGDHLDGRSKGARGQKFVLILGANLCILSVGTKMARTPS
jgi:hypothetical protein